MTSHAVARSFDPNYNADESSYAWIVNYDHLDSERVCIIGPHNASKEQQEILLHPRKNSAQLTRFKIYDDDGELYYSGYFLGDSFDEDAFGPLDDYGAPNAGATEIRYLRIKDGKEEWETL